MDGGEKTEGTETTAAVEDEKTTRVEFQNDYTKQTGSLELTKTIKGAVTEEEAAGALTFEIKAENGKYLGKDGKLTDKKTELTLADFEHEAGSDSYTLKIENVELGNYTVTETTKRRREPDRYIRRRSRREGRDHHSRLRKQLREPDRDPAADQDHQG